jgi:hypothetical protein
MFERIELKVSRFAQVFWLALIVVVAAFALAALVATVRLAAEREATGVERAAPLIALVLAGYLAWFFWWRLLPELRPMGQLRVSDAELVVDAPPFLREPIRVPRASVRAGVIDQPHQRQVGTASGALSASTISAESAEGFEISALVLHSSWPNLVLFLEPPVELTLPRLRARLLFPRRVRALLAQVIDPAQAAAVLAAWNLPPPDRSELTKRRPERQVRIARAIRFNLIAVSAAGRFLSLVIVGAWAGAFQ